MLMFICRDASNCLCHILYQFPRILIFVLLFYRENSLRVNDAKLEKLQNKNS